MTNNPLSTIGDRLRLVKSENDFVFKLIEVLDNDSIIKDEQVYNVNSFFDHEKLSSWSKLMEKTLFKLYQLDYFIPRWRLQIDGKRFKKCLQSNIYKIVEKKYEKN